MNTTLVDEAPPRKYGELALDVNATIAQPSLSVSHVSEWDDLSSNDRSLSADYEDHEFREHAWRFDDDLNDLFVNIDSIDGTLENQAYRWIPGKGLQFNEDVRIGVPNSAFKSVVNEVTIVMSVIGGADIDNLQTVLYEGLSSLGRRTLLCQGPWSDNKFYFDSGATDINGTGYDSVNENTNPNPENRRGVLTEWIFTKNAESGNVNIYVDGIQVVDDSGNDLSMEDIVNFSIGSDLAGTYKWTGIVKDFRVFNRFFTQGDVNLFRDGTPLPDYTVDFTGLPSTKMSGPNDSGSETIIGSGEGMHLEGDIRRSYTIPNYIVGLCTIIEFDFESTVEGDVQGIGFDTDDNPAGAEQFKLFGTQNDMNTDFDNYQLADGVKHYVIPIGTYFTANDIDRLHLHCEDGNDLADVKITNIHMYDFVPKSDLVLAGVLTASSELDATHAVPRVRNGVDGDWASLGESTPWVQIDWPTTQTINKVFLEDRVSAEAVLTGTLHFSDGSTEPVGSLDGAGLVEISFADKSVDWVKFQVNTSSGTNPGLATFKVMSTTTDALCLEYLFAETEGFNVPDTSGRNYHGSILPGIIAIDFNNHTISNFYTENDDANSTVTVEDAGATLHMQGDIWKKIDLAYIVTKDTVIEFDFEGLHEGESHSIGFEDNDTLTKNRYMQIWGTESYGRDDHNDYQLIDGVKHYKIRIGEIYARNNGSSYLVPASYLVFIGDDDNTQDSDVKWSNLKIYEEPIQVTLSKENLIYHRTSLRFLGGQGHINLQKPDGFTGPFSWTAMIKTKGRGMLLYERGDSTNGYSIGINHLGMPTLYMRAHGVDTTMILNVDVSDNEPHHIAISVSDLYAYGLIDGNWIGSESGSIRAEDPVDPSESAQLGQHTGTHPISGIPDAPFKGQIDALEIYHVYMDIHTLVAVSRLNTRVNGALYIPKTGIMAIKPSAELGPIHGTVFAVVNVRDTGLSNVILSEKREDYDVNPRPSTRLRQLGQGNRMGFTAKSVTDWVCPDLTHTCDYDELMVVAYTSFPGDNYIHVSKNYLGRSSILTDADYQIPVDVVGAWSAGFELHAYRIYTNPLTEGLEKYLMKQYMQQFGMI
jgi:hypothetical protein